MRHVIVVPSRTLTCSSCSLTPAGASPMVAVMACFAAVIQVRKLAMSGKRPS